MEDQENQFIGGNKALYALVLSKLLYSAELWPVSVTQMKKLEAVHHYRWQRSILGISWKDKVTNEKVDQKGNCMHSSSWKTLLDADD